MAHSEIMGYRTLIKLRVHLPLCLQLQESMVYALFCPVCVLELELALKSEESHHVWPVSVSACATIHDCGIVLGLSDEHWRIWL